MLVRRKQTVIIMDSYIVFGQLMALCASLCGAVSSIVYNRLGTKADSNILAYVRMQIAMPVTVVYALATTGWVPISLQSFVALFMSGLIGFFITDMFLFRGYVLWGAGETMVVMCLAPVLSSIFSRIIFGEVMAFDQICAMVMIVAGVATMVMADGIDWKNIAGVGFTSALLAAIFQSVSDMTAKFALGDTPWVTAAAVRTVGGIIGWWVFAAVKGKPFFKNIAPFKSPKFMGIMFVLVCIGTVLGPTISMAALKYAPAGIVTSLKQISPVFIMPLEMIIFRKMPKPLAVLGTAITVVGVLLLF